MLNYILFIYLTKEIIQYILICDNTKRKMTMKNKTIKILTMMLMFVCIVTFFVGCKEEEYYQPNMLEIESLLTNDENEPLVDGATKVDVNNIMYDYNAVDANMAEWQRYFERSNIDTTNFMNIDVYKCTGYFLQSNAYVTEDYYIYIFKFSNCEDSANCKEKLNRYEDYSSKQYGNLVVYAENIIAGHTFALIDTIEE